MTTYIKESFNYNSEKDLSELKRYKMKKKNEKIKNIFYVLFYLFFDLLNDNFNMNNSKIYLKEQKNFIVLFKMKYFKTKLD